MPVLADQRLEALDRQTAMPVREQLTDAERDDEDDHQLRQAERRVPIEPSRPAISYDVKLRPHLSEIAPPNSTSVHSMQLSEKVRQKTMLASRDES